MAENTATYWNVLVVMRVTVESPTPEAAIERAEGFMSQAFQGERPAAVVHGFLGTPEPTTLEGTEVHPGLPPDEDAAAKRLRDAWLVYTDRADAVRRASTTGQQEHE